VIPEDARHPWVGHDVGVPGTNTVSREGPVLLGGSCIMVVNEGHGLAGPPARNRVMMQYVIACQAIYRDIPSGLSADSLLFRGCV